MKPYHKNPRTITTRQFDDLAKWLDELGDLSPIVHNLETDEVISGNQRMRVFDINRCEIVITDELDQPDDQGTVATGYVVWKDSRYAYRAVRWDERTATKANVISNKAGGRFDFDVLANEFEIEDLLEWGFSEIELQIDALANDVADGSSDSENESGTGSYYALIVECETSAARSQLCSRLVAEGYVCRMEAGRELEEAEPGSKAAASDDVFDTVEVQRFCRYVKGGG